MAIFDPITSDEIWYPIPGSPGYEFSSEFRVRSWHKKGWRGGASDRPRILSVYRMPIGYLAVHFRVAGKARTVYLHDIVACLAFGPKPPGTVIRHYDDDKDNNYPSNLAIGRHVDNTADSRRNGRMALGVRCGTSKLTEVDVRAIRVEVAAGSRSLRSIARSFGINVATLIALRDRRTWTHVD
jgi:hypothetical protein